MRKITPKTIGKEMSLEEPTKIFPRFDISLEYLPEAKKWEVGETYKVTLHIKQTDVHMMDKEEGHVGFDIVAIEAKGKAKKSDKELPDLEE